MMTIGFEQPAVEPMKINFKQIEAFVWVTDLQSFRRAAERLNTTQPNISARIVNLEQALGITLMERDAGSVRLTAKGNEMLTEARRILRATEKFIDTAGRASQVASTIKLGVTEMIANTWLQQFLRAVRERYPNLNIELTVDLSANLKTELFSRSIDIAFQNGPFARTTSGQEDLGKFPFVWVGSPDLPVTKMQAPTMQDMLSVPILAHSRSAKQFPEIEAHFNGKGGKHEKCAKLVASSSISPCIHMAIERMGITAIPAAMACKYLDEGQLALINYHWVPEPLEFLARYDANATPAVVANIARLASEIALQHPEAIQQ